ncbi:MAG: hypothetical protein AAF170_01050 [Bacteroidota bacterium]
MCGPLTSTLPFVPKAVTPRTIHPTGAQEMAPFIPSPFRDRAASSTQNAPDELAKAGRGRARM